MAECQYNADSAYLPRPSLRSGTSGESKGIPVKITGFPAALAKATTPGSVISVLVDTASSYVARTDSLRRQTEHSSVPGKLASLIPSSIV